MPGNPRKPEERGSDVLADEENIDRTEIKVVVEGKAGEPVVCRVLAGIELETGLSALPSNQNMRHREKPHHDSLALILNDV